MNENTITLLILLIFVFIATLRFLPGYMRGIKKDQEQYDRNAFK